MTLDDLNDPKIWHGICGSFCPTKEPPEPTSVIGYRFVGAPVMYGSEGINLRRLGMFACNVCAAVVMLVDTYKHSQTHGFDLDDVPDRPHGD